MMSKHLSPFCFLLLTLVPLIFGCVVDNPKSNINQTQEIAMNQSNEKYETATFGAGCFWCVEAVFELVQGVDKVVSGYTGGETENPTYEQVCAEITGHAEAIEVHFNPGIIDYETILEIFFSYHDPTTLNRQGADVGTQYRSAIFYLNLNQQSIAQECIRSLEEENVFPDPIVTEIKSAEKFYVAEQYHQSFFTNNPYQPYC